MLKFDSLNKASRMEEPIPIIQGKEVLKEQLNKSRKSKWCIREAIHLYINSIALIESYKLPRRITEIVICVACSKQFT